MLQTLFLIPAKVAGYPVFGFGLLLTLWAVVSVGTLVRLVRRQGFNADTWSYVPILLLLGVVIAWVLPAICERGDGGELLGLPIRGYGVMMLTAVVSGTALAAWRAKRVGVDPELIFSLVFWMVIFGIIGARTFYVVEYWPVYWQKYAGPHGSLGALIGGIVNMTEGGLVVYGSFVGGVLGIILFLRKHPMPFLAVADLITPSMLLGAAIGRIGCLMNGCCYGAVCDHAWAIEFPPNAPPYIAQVERGQMYGFTLGGNPKTKPCTVLAVAPNSPADRAGLRPGDRIEKVGKFKIGETGQAYSALKNVFYERQPLELTVAGRPAIEIEAIAPPAWSLPVQPSQIISAIDAFLLCLLLLAYDPFHRRDGELFALMLSIYPVTRFLIEGLRTDEAPVFGTGMSIAQCVSLLLLACAAALWIYILRRPRGTAFQRQ